MMAAHEIVERLAVGWTMCERETDPERKEHLESHWIQLLQVYEQLIEQSMQTGAAA